MRIFSTLTLATIVLCAVATQARAQYGTPWTQNQSAMGLYQPIWTSSPYFQDGGVPIPSDSGVAGGQQGAASATPFDAGAPAPITGSSSLPGSELTIPMYDQGTTWNAFSPPVTQDPFLTPNAVNPYAPYNPYQPGIPPQGLSMYGANAPEPYRFGWTNQIDVSWLPGGSVTGAPAGVTGDMDIFGVDYELAYASPWWAGWVMNWTNQFSYRNWGGPDGTLQLPSDLFRFGADFELETPASGPFSLSFGITPSINTDFDGDVWGDGFQLDGRGIFLLQLDQFWTIGLGAQYWDRVDDRILPWAGLIYRDDYWEWQLMYPEAKVSLFLGNEAYWSKWLYVRAEYHVEAYGVNRTYAGVQADDQVEIADYRILLGMKMDAGLYSWFFEGGYVMDRQVEFASAVPGFDLDSGFIGQIGLRY